MKISILLLMAAYCFSCGSTLSDSEESVAPENVDRVKVSLFDHSFFTDDDLFELTCNQFFFAFWMNENTNGCKAVTVNTEYETEDDEKYSRKWEVFSPDKTVDMTFNELANADKLEIDSKEYHCLYYGGTAYGEDGEAHYFGQFTLLSTAPIDKPSQIVTKDVIAVGASYDDFCSAIYDDTKE